LSQGVPTKVVAASMGLSGFAVCMIAGLAVDNPLEVIVTRAIIAMAVSYVVGILIGLAAEVAVNKRLGELHDLVKSPSAGPTGNPARSTEPQKMPTI